jgi:hypothetical protein
MLEDSPKRAHMWSREWDTDVPKSAACLECPDIAFGTDYMVIIKPFAITPYVPPRTGPTPTILYRLWNITNTLQYVGITGKGIARFNEHNRNHPLMDRVTHCTTEHFPAPWQARAAEKRAIKAEHPLYNIDSAIIPGRSRDPINR